eukprot:TRINITY_DN13198_c0_g1_i2.p1 TRINITY_DN13198_c0_g1~~TRINITY_DN13198_c0_g1_i2.p1  ORF type:complete len:438 (+),score=110.33 TRINITY_DN13198_c0_g1_i2:122-1435(+)
MIRRPPRSTLSSSSAASDVYKRQLSVLSEHNQLIHCSELISSSFNPTFLPLQPAAIIRQVGWECHSCVVQVWSLPHSEADLGEIIINRTLHLPTLIKVPDTEQHGFEPNTLVLEFADGMYTQEGSLIQIEEADTPRRPGIHQHPKNETSMSYAAACFFMEKCLDWRLRMDAMEKEMGTVKEKLAVRLASLNKATRQAQQRRRRQLRLEQLHKRVAEERIQVMEQREALAHLQQALPPHAAAVQQAPLMLAEKAAALELQREGLEPYQAVLAQVSSTYDERCWGLVAKFFAIFPIRATKDPGILQIHGIPLHVTKDFAGCDEESVCTAIGYACHLLYHLAKLLGICLKHPLIPGLSHSRISVDSSNQLRPQPLFYKGSEKRVPFDYGLYLMNKDIAQLLRSVGIKCNHPSETLPNLHAIYRTRCNPVLQNSTHDNLEL